MNRELKFRAWLKRSQEMYQVEILDFEKKQAFIFTDDFDLWADFNEIELMQFTTFLDKNGKEIYEGDILKSNYKDYIYWVKYENGGFYIYYDLGRYGSMEQSFETPEFGFEVGIIGNIHDNPELLEKWN